MQKIIMNFISVSFYYFLLFSLLSRQASLHFLCLNFSYLDFHFVLRFFQFLLHSSESVQLSFYLSQRSDALQMSFAKMDKEEWKKSVSFTRFINDNHKKSHRSVIVSCLSLARLRLNRNEFNLTAFVVGGLFFLFSFRWLPSANDNYRFVVSI